MTYSSDLALSNNIPSEVPVTFFSSTVSYVCSYMYTSQLCRQPYRLYLNSHVGVASWSFQIEKNILTPEFPESITKLTV
jgi:hypothetical protein